MRIVAVLLLVAGLAAGQTRPAQSHASSAQQAKSLLDDALHEKNPDVRKEAVIALSLEGPKAGNLQVLTSMAVDSDVPVRLAVISALNDFNDRRTIPLLKKLLDDPVPEVDFAAAKVLYRFHEPEGEQFLMAVVEGESKAKSGFIASTTRSALRLAHTPAKLVTTATEAVVGTVVPVPGIGLGISSVQGILLDPAATPRAGALLLLARDKGPEIHTQVRDALSDKDWSLRAAAVHLIAMHPYPDLRQNLVPLLDDKKDAVRLRAAAAYLRLTTATRRKAAAAQ